MSIEEICEKYGIENYTINDDGSIDVDDHVSFPGKSGLSKTLVFALNLNN